MPSKRGQKLLAALEELEEELHRAERRNESVSLILIDFDDLGVFTERNGKKAANKVLSDLGGVAARACRETDVVTRIGRDDVALFLSGASKEDASRVARRIHSLIEEHEFSGEKELPGGKLTASLGVASYPMDAGTPSELAGCADRALYLAKVSGKNRVRLYDDNKRSRRRKAISLRGDFSTLELRHEPLRTIDMSTIGVRFAAECELPPDVLIDIRLRVPGVDHQIEMAARVLRCREIRRPSSGWFSGRFQTIGGSYEIAVRILEIGSNEARALTLFLWGPDGGR